MENAVETAHEQRFLAAEDATIDARKEGERARDYRDGKQLTPGEISALKKRGQPPVVTNRIRRKVDFLLGLEVKQRTDPRAFPRTPDHEQGAEAATDAIRFVCDNENWDDVRTGAYDNMLVEGFGGCEVLHEQNNKGEVQIVLRHIPWDRLYYDPHSRKHDFSDARYVGEVVWADEDDIRKQYPDTADRIEAMRDDCKGHETYDDRPHMKWLDPKRKRVRIIQEWYKDGGKWKYIRFIRGVTLEEGESPYFDDEGNSECPMILQSAYVGRNNDRHGIVRDMFDPQDEVNKRRSKALHLFTMRQVKMTKGVADPADVRQQLARPDGLVMLEGDKDDVFEILPTGDLASGQAALLQEAKDEIDLMGANAALAGETGESASGRAVLARQQGGMVEIAWLMDRLHYFTRRVYRAIWNRIRQFWTEQRWIRVTDDERNVRFVGLNRPVTLGEHLSQYPEEQVREYMAMNGLGLADLQSVVDVENAVERLDVDILIEEVPDRVTLQGEAFEAMLKYAQSGAIPPEVLIQADPMLPARKKERLMDLLQRPQAPNPAQELEMAEKQAGIQKTQAETAKIATETMPLAL